MKVVVLVSGGMDSVTALYQAASEHRGGGRNQHHYGSKHNHKEIPFAARHCERLGVPHRVIELAFINELFASDLLESGGVIPDGHYEEQMMKQTVVPFRNGIMLSISAGYAESVGAKGVVIAAHAGDHAIYPDCREVFMQSLGDAIRSGTYAGIHLLRPLIDLSKDQVARRGYELGIDFSKTWSCYKGEDVHCGICGTCVERREAFELAGLPEDS